MSGDVKLLTVAEHAELVGALLDAHTAIDTLFAILIAAQLDPPFFPSRSVVWPTLLRISAVLDKHAPKAPPSCQ